MTTIDIIEDISQMDVLPGMTLKQELGFDSFDMSELRSIIEDQFHTEIPDDTVARWITVADVLETTDKLKL